MSRTGSTPTAHASPARPGTSCALAGGAVRGAPIVPTMRVVARQVRGATRRRAPAARAAPTCSAIAVALRDRASRGQPDHASPTWAGVCSRVPPGSSSSRPTASTTATSKRISHGTVDDLPWVFHARAARLACCCWLLPPASRARTIALKRHPRCSAVVDDAVCAGLPYARRAARSPSRCGPERVLLVGEDDADRVLARKIAQPPRVRREARRASASRPLSRSARATPRDLRPARPASDDLDLEPSSPSHGVERVVVAHEDFDERDAARPPAPRAASSASRSASCLSPSTPWARRWRSTTSRASRSSASTRRCSRAPRAFLKRAMDIVGSRLLLVLARRCWR